VNADRSWEALLKPGEAGEYFVAPNRAGLFLELAAPGFSPVNAWWLAELSRLIYREDRDEAGENALEPTRREILEEAGFEEVARFAEAETYGALVVGRGAASGHGRRVAALVFRGTNSPRDWLTNIRIGQGRAVGEGLVHDGFFDALHGVWDEVRRAIRFLDCPYFCTGHSLGAALATVAAARLYRTSMPPHSVYTFGSPRVGNGAFAASLKSRALFRVVNDNDCVVLAPPSIGMLDYCHAGELHPIEPSGGLGRASSDPPASGEEAEDGERDLSSFKEMFDVRNWFEPPSYLSDHAPVNYVKGLAQYL